MEGLRQKRKERRLTLRKMAEITGLAYQTYCNYEYGRCEPSLKTLKRMARIFDCLVDDLL